MEYNQERIVEAIHAFQRGEIIIVTDDDGRENEGDLIVAATHCTAEKMAFFMRHTTGIICTSMPEAEAKRLDLPPMVQNNDSVHHTAFTVSIDYKHGTTTGISAQERALTVCNLANPAAVGSDFVRPGHVFPLIAREGGVLVRSGHTEAAVDLCRLAGLAPFGVLSELVNEDGTVTKGPQLTAFAQQHKLHLITVAELIAYRQRQEKLIQRCDHRSIETAIGPAQAYTYHLPWESMQHIAIVLGDISDGENIPVRLHHEDVFADVFGGSQLINNIMKSMIEQEGRGIFVYLREGSDAVSAMKGGVAESHAQALKREAEWRHIGLGAQILKDLMVHSVIVYASKERHYIGLEGFGIKITRTHIL